MKNIKYLLTAVLSLCVLSVAAQTRVTGRVFHATDGPVVMASVVEVTPDNRNVSATQTDANGEFSLNIQNPEKNKLKVSYLGYQTVTTKVIGEQTTFEIEMKDRVREQGTAVVTATRKVKSNGLDIPQREISFARQTLDMDDMEGLSFETAGEALQGQIAGLDVVMNSGSLGAGTSMRLRGVASIHGSQEPLIVVDGYILRDYSGDELNLDNLDDSQMFANLLQISPDDIQKIEVLKDAAATAQWGSEGSNGVISITTRRGKRGKTKLGFSYRLQGRWLGKRLNMLKGDDYTMMLQQAYFNPAYSDVVSNIPELMYDPNAYDKYANFNKNTDWIDEISQFGLIHNFGVNISGGGEKALFRISGNYDHETNSFIAEKLDRFTSRLALDYIVSDRITFRSNFSLSYTNNKYPSSKYPSSSALVQAMNAMPNMSVYRYEYDNEALRYYNTGEYYIMPYWLGGISSENVVGRSSYYLSDMVQNGNPVASAKYSWGKKSQYSITPQFQIDYELLGKETDEHQLRYTGEVYLSASTYSVDTYDPKFIHATIATTGVDLTTNGEFKALTFRTKHSLRYIPHFENTKHSLQLMVRGEMGTSDTRSQNVNTSGIAGGISSSLAKGYLYSPNTSTSKGHDLSGMFSTHYSFSEKYSFDFTLRADGSSAFGKGKRWGFFPGISARWNISDEKFFEPLKSVVSMLSFRPSWGINGGNKPGASSQYNTYGPYGNYNGTSAIVPTNLRLTTIRWEKKKEWNLGFDLGLFNDLITMDLNIYNRKITDLMNYSVSIPSITGYSSLSAANVGAMENEGWELNIQTAPLFKKGKFYMKARFNIAQNINTITQMDASVLASANTDFQYTNESTMSRVQIGHSLGGIYGFRWKGIYAYDYDHSGYFQQESKNRYANTAKNDPNPRLQRSTPIAFDAQGNVIYDKNGNPLHMTFNYGGLNYQFDGGDVIYEDINHDGQIDDLDIVYLGNSNPKLNGGFGFDFVYGNWSLKANFTYRAGNKIINLAKMRAEDMLTNKNQLASVKWRWRKNGDDVPIPRAMNQTQKQTYNSLINDRYVEDGDFVRFQYLQIAYNFPAAKIKKYGLSNLRLSFNMNNLLCWTKYSGLDPEKSTSGYDPCIDSDKYPISRSFTFSLSFGF